jgi:hypothetical protein
MLPARHNRIYTTLTDTTLYIFRYRVSMPDLTRSKTWLQMNLRAAIEAVFEEELAEFLDRLRLLWSNVAVTGLRRATRRPVLPLKVPKGKRGRLAKFCGKSVRVACL